MTLRLAEIMTGLDQVRPSSSSGQVVAGIKVREVVGHFHGLGLVAQDHLEVEDTIRIIADINDPS